MWTCGEKDWILLLSLQSPQKIKKIYGGVVLALIVDAPIMKKYKRNILNVNKYLVYIWTFYIRTRSFAAIFFVAFVKEYLIHNFIGHRKFSFFH
jgi:hypothetical protein